MSRASLLLPALLIVTLAHAQESEEKKYGWFFTAEFSAVWTAGNSESRTFGLGSTVRRVWPTSTLKFEAGGTRTESTLTTRTAVGTSPNDFKVRTEEKTEKTAELFYVRGRYDHQVGGSFFVFGGSDWLRNRFAGIDSRFLLALGVGNSWLDRETLRFKTDASATYTFQTDVIPNPATADKFGGVRLAYDFWWQLTESTDFTSVLTVDWNLNNTKDVRFDYTNAFTVAISKTLAFKPSLQLLWRNDPALTRVPLLAPDGSATGETVLVPLQKLDTLFTVSLVVRLQ